MSAALMGRSTWHQGISCPEKMVLVAIADVSDDNGLAYMLIETLMQKTSLSRRGAQSAIAGLIDKRILMRRERRHRSSIFKIIVEALPAGRPTPPPERELSDDHLWSNLQGAGDAPSPVIKGAGGAPQRAGGAPQRAGGAPQRAGGAPQRAGGAPILPVTTPVDTPDSPHSLTGVAPPQAGFDLIEPDRQPDVADHVLDGWAKLKVDHPGIVGIRTLNDARRKKIRARASEIAAGEPGAMTLNQVWDQIFEAIRGSQFLRGEAEPGKGYSRPFALTLDKILEPAFFIQTLERAVNDADHNAATVNPVTGRRRGPAEQSGRDVLARILARRQQRAG